LPTGNAVQSPTRKLDQNFALPCGAWRCGVAQRGGPLAYAAWLWCVQPKEAEKRRYARNSFKASEASAQLI